MINKITEECYWGHSLSACNDALNATLQVCNRSVYEKIGPYEVCIFVNIGPFEETGALHTVSHEFLQCFEDHVTIFAEIDFFRIARTRPWSWITMRRFQSIPHLPQAIRINPSRKHCSARGGVRRGSSSCATPWSAW